MDTSPDLSSLTYDFLAGVGENLPNPTSEQYARRMIEIGERLWRSDALSSIIGNRRVHDEYALEKALSQFLPERFDLFKNDRVVELTRPGSSTGGFFTHDGIRSRIYLGYTRGGIFWFLVEEYAWDHRVRNSPKGPLGCTELDLTSMTALFSRHESWVTPLPYLLVDWLVGKLERTREERRHKLLRLDRQYFLLDNDRSLFRAAAESPLEASGWDN